MGSRADLRATAGRPFHLLRREVPPALNESRPRRRTRSRARGPLEEELLRLWTTQTHQGGKATRTGLWKRPGRATDETPGHPGRSRAKSRFTTHADKNNLRAPDLVQAQLRRLSSQRVWVADFTYCSTWSGVVYVAFIIDVFSRRFVGWKASRTMTASLVVDALNMAAWTRRTKLDGLICHTDAGSQYTSVSYTDRIDELGVSASIGTVGDSFDNAMAESVMGIFKTELHRNPAVWPTTEVTGKDSTTSRSPRARGCRGSTKNDFTASSTTARHSKLRKSILSQIKPRWREISKFGSLQETQADSRFCRRPTFAGHQQLRPARQRRRERRNQIQQFASATL